MSTDLTGGQDILGCPISSFLSIESVCSFTNVPPCATGTSIVYDAACCGSLTSYGLSLFSCIEQHAPTCLDTSGIAASITGEASGTNPCAAFATPIGGGSGSSKAAPSTTPAATVTSSTANGSSGASGATGTSAPATTAAPSGSAAGSSVTGAGASASASVTGKSGAPPARVAVGLKVYVGVALVAALAVVAL